MNPNEIAESIESEAEVETSEPTEPEVELEEVEEEEEVQEDEVAKLKKKLATLEAQKEHWREKAAKQAAEPKADSEASNLSLADLRAIASVHEDDVDRVERYAKAEGMSIKDALKDPELKAILSLREEQRSTAAATNTGNSRRSTAKVSEAKLIEDAKVGRLPEDDEGIARLIAAKRKLK